MIRFPTFHPLFYCVDVVRQSHDDGCPPPPSSENPKPKNKKPEKSYKFPLKWRILFVNVVVVVLSTFVQSIAIAVIFILWLC